MAGAWLCGAMVAASCAVGPTFQRPAAPAVSRYSHDGDSPATPIAHGVSQQFPRGAGRAQNWWRLFESDALNAAVVESLAQNPGLQAAQASLRASQDNLRSGYGIFYPAVSAGAAATRERYALPTPQPARPSSVFNLFTLGTTVSFALDVFGGQRRLIEQLHAQLDVAEAEEQATYLALTSNVVNTLICGAAYRAEIQATEELIALQSEQTHLAEINARAGTASYSAVLTLKTQLAAYQATIPPLQQKLSQSEHLLAALAGHAPAEWSPAVVDLQRLHLPTVLPVSLPSELTRRRPDVLAAEATAHAASAQIGISTAALFPSVSLAGGLSTQATSTGALLSPASKLWNISASASAPLFQGGALWYKRRAAQDSYRAAMALYRQTVLGAIAQVADALRALENDALLVIAEDEAVAESDEALRLVEANYEAGIAPYLQVLIADVQSHQARIADIQATALRYQDTVALIAASGGGWQAERPPLAP